MSKRLGAPASPPAVVQEPTRTSALPGLVPKLRFPEFRDEACWDCRRLDSVCSAITQGGTPDTSVAEYWNGDIYWLTPAEMGKSESPSLRATDRTITEAGLRNCSSVLLPINSVILSTRAPIGHLAINQSPTAINQGCKGLVPSGELDFRFLYFSLASNRSRLSDLGAGNTFKELSGSALKSFTTAFPRLAEQEKIAECLSTLDELIVATSQKLDALKAHKKGLMQQLFPREGETLPRFRFPEFRDEREWAVKKLGEIGRVIRGASPRPQGDARYYGGPVPRLMVQDVTRDGKWVTPKIDSLTHAGAKLSRPCPAGTLTIVCSGTVGIVSFLAVDACIHDGFLALIEIDESTATKDFLFHSLTTLRDQFEKGATHGGVFTNLTTTGIEQFEIACPQPIEQQRIASCLSSLDDLISAQSSKLEALKTHKKGLMQQLFPSPAEADA